MEVACYDISTTCSRDREIDILHGRDNLGQLEYLKHDDEIQLEIVQLTEKIWHFRLFETPDHFGAHGYLGDLSLLITDLGQFGHAFNFLEYMFTMVLYIGDGIYGQWCWMNTSFFHGHGHLFQHEGEVRDGSRYILYFDVCILHLHLDGIEGKGETKASAGSGGDSTCSVHAR